jgi:ketosteroid isomerase-like protein
MAKTDGGRSGGTAFTVRGAMRSAAAMACVAWVAGCATSPQRVTNADLQKQVADAERAFARTMADRDFAAFGTFVSSEAIFFAGPKALRGRQEVIDAWKRFFDKPQAPFSWKPETVEVLDSGTLALSSGPVFDPAGKQFATFTSIWRLESQGTWRVIFDKGNDVCDCAKPP